MDPVWPVVIADYYVLPIPKGVILSGDIIAIIGVC